VLVRRPSTSPADLLTRARRPPPPADGRAAQKILADQMLGHYGLKAEVAAQLGGCFRLMADLGRARKEMERGLDACRRGGATSEAPLLLRWTCHLRLALADACAIDGRGAEAAGHLDAGLAAATEQGLAEQRVLFLLARAQLAMAQGEGHAAAGAALAAAAEAAEALPPGGGAGPSGSQQPTASQAPPGLGPGFAPHARLHCAVLQTLHALRVGNIKELQQPAAAGGGAAAGAPPPPPPAADGSAAVARLEACLRDVQGA